MTIYLIRHGETASNARRVIQTPEAPLSERGRQQAGLLAARLADAGIVRILASDLARAAMTAEALARTTGAAISLNALLQERNFGDIRGTAYEGVGVDIFADDYVPPGGESWAAFHRRVAAAWELILHAVRTAYGSVGVITHGLVCRALVARHCRLPVGWSPPPGWANTSLTAIDAAPPWEVRLLNCTAHLDEDSGAVPVDRPAV